MYYKQPQYFGKFRCSGTDCTANCCFGWYINWTKSELDKIKLNPNCSPELAELIEKSFIQFDEKKPNNYMVKFGEDGRCPCQTEEGLCRIQKELGAEYLSNTCTVYPRYNSFYDKENDIVYRACYLSCQEIVRLLVNDEKAMDLVSIPIKEPKAQTVVYLDSDEDVLVNPILKKRCEIFDFLYKLIGDKKIPVETAIILGALVAQKITQLSDRKQYDMISEALQAFKKQIHSASALQSIEKIKPNYNVKFGVADKIIENALDFRMTDFLKSENGELDINRYIIGEQKLNEMMKDKPFWLRNIALNLILELCVPFKSKKHTIFENYSFFVAAIACVKLNAIAAAFAPEKLNIQTKGQTLHFEGIEKIYGLTGIISRRIFQSSQAFEKVTKVLNEFDMDSPAYLALLVK